MGWPRLLVGMSLAASACGPAVPPAAEPPAPAATQAPAGPAPVELPTLSVVGDELQLDGQRVASVAELADAPGYQLVSGLDEALDRRAAGDANPNKRSLRLRIPDQLGQQPLVSALLTAAAAGFDRIVAERAPGELRFELFQPPQDDASAPDLQVVWLRVSADGVHLTRWPEVKEELVPVAKEGPRHAGLRSVLERECQTPESACYDAAIVSVAPDVRAGELMEVVEALTAGRRGAANRPSLTIDFGGRAAGPERDPAAMHQVLRSGRKMVQGCYKAALEKNPKLAGRIMVRFMVDRDGSVAAAHGSDAGTEASPRGPAIPPLGDAAVTECVEKVFRTLKFEEAGLSTGNYPIVFSSK